MTGLPTVETLRIPETSTYHRKMTAPLQVATSSDEPVLLRLEATGHLTGSLDQSIDATTDLYAFGVRPAGSRRARQRRRMTPPFHPNLAPAGATPL